MKKLAGSTAGKLVALAIVMAMCLFSAQAATATTSQSPTAAGATERRVAHTNQGDLNSRIAGTTGNGRKVTGSFVPLKFVRHDGKVYVRGLIQGVVHERNGTRTTFAKIKTIRVKSISGAAAPAGRVDASRATCGILNLVLAPLDLNLLGLKVHLDRVVLNIVAESGAGNLLGNLLCAVTGLLDGGLLGGLLGGQLGQVTTLLNRILGLLRLG
jgi:hypothetical protein